MARTRQASFPGIACVRQTEILEVKSQAEALQNHIQRAADTACVDQTAAAALARIEDFRSLNTGLVRPNVNRPLAKATRAAEAVRRNLDVARQQHASYLGLVAEADKLQEKARDSEIRLQLFRAAIAGRDADLLQARLDRVCELQVMSPRWRTAALTRRRQSRSGRPCGTRVVVAETNSACSHRGVSRPTKGRDPATTAGPVWRHGGCQNSSRRSGTRRGAGRTPCRSRHKDAGP